MAITEKDKKVLQIVGVIIPVVILLAIFLPSFQLGKETKPASSVATPAGEQDAVDAQDVEADGEQEGKAVPAKPEKKQAPPLRILGLKELYGEYQKVSKQVTDLEQEVKDKTRKVERKHITLAEVGDLERRIDLWENRLPDSPRLDGLMAELNTLAQVAGQEYVSMKMQPFREKSTHSELPLEIKLVTDYHALGNFINMTEYSERFSKVDDLNIQGDREFPGRVNVSLVFSTFSFVPELQTDEENEATSTTVSGASGS